MDELRLNLLKDGLADSTFSNYGYGTALYLSFCEFYNLNPYPTDTAELYLNQDRYLTYRLYFAQGTHASIKTDISSIQFHLACKGIHSNIRNDHLPWKRILKAAETKFPSKKQKSRALSISEFKRMVDCLPPTSIDSLVARTIFTVAFATGMRGTEFLASNNKPRSRKASLLLLRRDRVFIWEDKESGAHFGVVWFFKSKTNQGWAQEFATIPCCCKLGFCPIKDLILLISQMKNVDNNTILFTWSNGTLATKSQLRLLLRNVAKQIDILDFNQIGTHSTRKLCIQFAIVYGLPDTVVIQIGRWKSFNSIRPYIEMSPLDLLKSRCKSDDRHNQTNKDRFKLLLGKYHHH